jgi:hypothetical protein
MHGRGFNGGMMGGWYGMHGGWGFFNFFGGLFRLAILIGVIWLGYALIKRSGWRLVKDAPSAGDDDAKPSA